MDSSFIKIIYKAVGKGTEYMSSLDTGTVLDVLTGLGNGYDLTACGKSPVLIGGGAGVPPMLFARKKAFRRKKRRKQ